MSLRNAFILLDCVAMVRLPQRHHSSRRISHRLVTEFRDAADCPIIASLPSAPRGARWERPKPNDDHPSVVDTLSMISDDHTPCAIVFFQQPSPFLFDLAVQPCMPVGATAGCHGLSGFSHMQHSRRQTLAFSLLLIFSLFPCCSLHDPPGVCYK